MLCRKNNTHTTINNNIISLAFTFNVNSTTVSKIESGNTVPFIKGYNGTGTAVIDKMQVNFTKVTVYICRNSSTRTVSRRFNWLISISIDLMQ
jgi:hypothetical protein